MKKKYIIIIFFFIMISIFLYIFKNYKNIFNYDEKKYKIITIGATSFPHIEILKISEPLINSYGYKLKIKEFSDYTLINAALNEKTLDANFFQHEPFLNTEIKNHKYNLISIAKIMIEPMAIYSYKIKNLKELKSGDTIALPNDESNLSRSLFLLKKYNIINFENNIFSPTIKDIKKNIKKIKFIEIDAASLPSIIKDPKVVAGVINTNFALLSNLNPIKDNIGIEDKISPYSNIIVIRSEDKNKNFVKILISALKSKEVKSYILNNLKNKGIIPAF